MKITNNEQLIKFFDLGDEIQSEFDHKIIANKTIEGLHFDYCPFTNFSFNNCNFKNCTFDNLELNGIEFLDCYISDCSFHHVIFMDCNLSNCIFNTPFSNSLLFGMTSFENVEFKKLEFQFTTFSDCSFDNIKFTGGTYHSGKFESGDSFYMYKSKMTFDKTELSTVIFDKLDLTAAVFKSTGNGISIINCNLSAQTFINSSPGGISSVDFFTLIKSEILPEDVLRNIFGINDKNIKQILSHLINERNFHSAFISYSFKNAEIAKEIKRGLEKNGVKTFLWEKDAPGGKKLKRIMIDNIREYEKFIFIASEQSLKSEACHYEIAEAREKYYKTWSDIFVPIHIDNYLFQIRKEDIPIKFINIYWENVQELKEVHSLDFTFAADNNPIELHIQFEKLLDALKLKKDEYLK